MSDKLALLFVVTIFTEYLIPPKRGEEERMNREREILRRVISRGWTRLGLAFDARLSFSVPFFSSEGIRGTEHGPSKNREQVAPVSLLANARRLNEF